jgi:uncharacterized membrane protein YgcG
MTKLVAITVAMAVAILMVPSIGQAQNVITLQGKIQAVDCQANTLTLSASGSSQVFPAAPSTAVFVNSAPAASFCALQQYVGSNAAVWVTASGDQLLAGRVDVSVAAAPIVPESVPSYGYGGPYYGGPYNGPYYGPYFYPFFGVGIDVGPGFFDRDDFRRDRDFGRDRDFRHDRDFHGGDRGGPRGSGNNGSHGAGMNGGSQGGGMHGGSRGGAMNGGFHGGGHGGGRR